MGSGQPIDYVCQVNGTTWAQATGTGGAATWGTITGTVSNQLDLGAILNAKQATITGAPGTWPTFAAVATSGSYLDLSNKPTLSSLGGFANPMSAAGDFIVGGSGGAPQRFPVPGNGTFCPSWSSGVVSWITCPGAGGGISSIGLTMPSWFSVSGSPLTANGTLGVTAATGQTSHQVVGTCGTATTFAPCALVAGDIPTIPTTQISGLAASATTDTTNAANISTGTLPHARLPALVSGDIPNNAANTSGTAGGLSTALATNLGGTAVTSPFTGLRKANGASADTAAVAGTDYQAPITGLTTNTIPKAASSSTIANSSINDDGTTVSTTENISTTGGLSAGSGTANSGYSSLSGATSGSIGFTVPNVAGTATLYQLPPVSTANSSYVLSIDNASAACPTLPPAAPTSTSCPTTKWVANGGAGTGDFVKIAQQTVSSSVTTITFSAIAGTYSNLILTGSKILNSGSFAACLQINGDTGNNYNYTQVNFSNNANYSPTSLATNCIGISPLSNGDANYTGSFRLSIGGYATGSGYPTVLSRGGAAPNACGGGSATGGVPCVFESTGVWLNSAAITSLTIMGGTYTAGVFTLYGEK